jgi:site-specific DNA-cytosine methylase
MGAADVGAPHQRDRLWLVAHAQWDKQSWEKSCDRPDGRVGWQFKPVSWDRDCASALREFRGMDDGLAYGVERTDCIRNGQVPLCAATAWRYLSELL